MLYNNCNDIKINFFPGRKKHHKNLVISGVIILLNHTCTQLKFQLVYVLLVVKSGHFFSGMTAPTGQWSEYGDHMWSRIYASVTIPDFEFSY